MVLSRIVVLLEKVGEIYTGFIDKPIYKIGKAWTEERKEYHRKRMRVYWENVKKG